MSQFAISDQTAADLNAKAAAQNCTLDDLLRSMLRQFESDQAFVERLETSELGDRMAADLKKDHTTFTTSEEVSTKFEELFQHLRSK